MSTIEEDIKEISAIDNRTETETQKSQNETDYIDVTGISSNPDGATSPRKRRGTRYVNDDEFPTATDDDDEYCRVHEETRATDETEETDESKEPQKLKVYKSLIDESETKNIKEDSMTETPDANEFQSSKQRKHKRFVRRNNYEEVYIHVKRLNKEKCKKNKRSRKRKREKDKEKRRTATSSVSADTSTQHQTFPGKCCATQAQLDEWFYEEQQRLWEQMCAKMAEYSYRFGYSGRLYPAGLCYSYSGCRSAMCDPRQLLHQCKNNLYPRY